MNGSQETKNSQTVFSGLSNEQKAVMIPYYILEGNMERAEAEKKRWIRLSVALICVIVIMVIGFFIYESQFETYSYISDANYESDVETSVINTGTGTVNYDEHKDQANSQDSGEEEQQKQPDKNLPDM